MAKDKPSIPGAPHELSPGWITDTMRSAGTLPPEVSVVGLRLESLTEPRLGLTGETVRIHLYTDVDHPAVPASVIAKFPSADPDNRGIMESFDAYAREIRFYRDLATRIPARVPVHHGSDYDTSPPQASVAAANRVVERLPARAQTALTKDVTKFMRPTKRRYVLLIEDLGPDAVVHGLNAPPSMQDLRRVLELLAGIHARFWKDPHIADHPAMRRLITDIPTTFVNVHRQRCREMAEKRWGNWLNAQHRMLLDRAADQFTADVELVNEPYTLVHGDPRSDNLLFLGDGDIAVVNWSRVAHAHPGYDVGHLLGSSVPMEDGPEVGRELVWDYQVALSAHGVDLGFEELWAGVTASCRAIAVQQVNSLAVLHGGYTADSTPADLWLPRLLGMLAA